MKKKIFYKVFAATLACVLLMFVFGIVAVNMNTNNIVNQRLREETELAATLINEQSDFAVFNKYSDNPELRITIFDMGGNVLYESDTKAPLENHADREEIKNALEGKPDTVIEFKTTKRSEDWADDIPEYYALQAALYAYLLGVDDVIMVASFLETKDYPIEREDGTFDTSPAEAFVPNAKNTITREFKVSQRYPNFAEMVAQAQAWWDAHVATGISPEFDEKKDAEILKALRTNNLTPDTDMDALIAEAETLKAEVDKATAALADKEKRLKEIGEIIKEHAVSQFRDGDKKVEVKGKTYTWTIARSETTTIDKDAMKADGVLDKYQKKSTQFRMTVK